MIFNQAMPSIGGGGGGSSQLYVFVDNTGYQNTEVWVGSTSLIPMVAYSDASIVNGATVKLMTYGDYILDTVTGMESGDTISFNTLSRGQYTFTMPNESVHCSLLYDD